MTSEDCLRFLISLLSEEELIRIGRRAENHGCPALAMVLSAELHERELSARREANKL